MIETHGTSREGRLRYYIFVYVLWHLNGTVMIEYSNTVLFVSALNFTPSVVVASWSFCTKCTFVCLFGISHVSLKMSHQLKCFLGSKLTGCDNSCKICAKPDSELYYVSGLALHIFAVTYPVITGGLLNPLCTLFLCASLASLCVLLSWFHLHHFCKLKESPDGLYYASTFNDLTDSYQKCYHYECDVAKVMVLPHSLLFTNMLNFFSSSEWLISVTLCCTGLLCFSIPLHSSLSLQLLCAGPATSSGEGDW